MIIQDIGEPPLLDLERQVLMSGMSWTGNLLGQFLQLVAEFAVPRHNLVPPDLAVHQAIGYTLVTTLEVLLESVRRLG